MYQVRFHQGKLYYLGPDRSFRTTLPPLRSQNHCPYPDLPHLPIFLQCVAERGIRKGGRNLAGYSLDKYIPLSKSFKNNLQKRLKPLIEYFEKNCWDYNILLERWRKGQRVTLHDYLIRVALHTRIYGIAEMFYRGQIFMGLAKIGLMTLSVADVGRYLYNVYRYPKEKDKNLKLCLRQAIKWTVGSEIGNAGFDFGAALSNKHWSQTGFLMDVLWSAAFDQSLHKWFTFDQPYRQHSAD